MSNETKGERASSARAMTHGAARPDADEAVVRATRRALLAGAGAGLGALTLQGIARAEGATLGARNSSEGSLENGGGPAAKRASTGDTRAHHAPRAKRVVWLFQSGGPSQLDLFDEKPALRARHGEQLPESIRRRARLTTMSANQTAMPLFGSPFAFARHGASGLSVSELLPHTARIADQLCVVRSVRSDAINHDPAITFMQTGSQIAGRPSIGAWLSYGLGNASRDLPDFVALITKDKGGQPLYQRLWGAGFLPARYQGTQLRSGKDPVLFLADPPGVSRSLRRRWLDAQAALAREDAAATLDPASEERIAQAELAFRMQLSVPEVADLAAEPDEVFELYGEDAREPGTYAANCLLARRLLERGVRTVQLFHKGWDQHDGIRGSLPVQCRETDRASAALVTDLARRGLLEDTLVVWGGEFGRTLYSQGFIADPNCGRDHHPRSFTVWLAGGGTRAGHVHGETDELGFEVVRDEVHVHDLHALILHLLGIDHERLTFPYQGRRFRLTDVHGTVPRALLA